MNRREEIADLYGRIGDLFHRLAVLYREAPSPPSPPPPAPPPPDRGGAVDVRPTPKSPAADAGPPRDGRALFAWARDNGLLPRVKALGKSRRYRGKIIEWSPVEAADVYQAVTAKLPAGSYHR